MDTATATRPRTDAPVLHYWGMVKDLDDSIKLDLISMLAESLKPLPSKNGKEIIEPELKPYTREELYARIAISERQRANGEWQDFDEAIDEIEREIRRPHRASA